MHGNFERVGRDGAFPILLFGALAAIGFALMLLGKPDTRALAQQPEPKAVLPSPARLRKSGDLA